MNNQLISLLLLCSLYIQCIANNDEYFFEPDLTEEQIQKIEQEKRIQEAEKKRLEEESKKKEEPPEFFKKNEQNDKNNKMDWDKYYAEKIISEYMKKMQAEQLEKRRLKAKTDLNHPMLSVITLVVFFGLGTFIGLIIMFVRSRQFQNTKNNKPEKLTNNNNNSQNKTIYNKVEQNDQAAAINIV